MGVVIGETAEIGDYVTLFQGVTLGGAGKERGKRHPTLGNHVVGGAVAKILGGITIGGNSVVLKNVTANSTVIGVLARVIKTQGERLPDATKDHSNLPDPVSERLLALEQELIELRKKVENQDSPPSFSWGLAPPSAAVPVPNSRKTGFIVHARFARLGGICILSSLVFRARLACLAPIS